jgi:hypothetical protein
VAAGVTRFIADNLVDNQVTLRAIRNAGYKPRPVCLGWGVTRVIVPLIPAEQTTD